MYRNHRSGLYLLTFSGEVPKKIMPVFEIKKISLISICSALTKNEGIWGLGMD
jgi:hypothetical protein